jgi:hypothetical protein
MLKRIGHIPWGLAGVMLVSKQMLRQPFPYYSSGFDLKEPETVKALVESYQTQWPRLASHWRDIKEHLRYADHHEGIQLSRQPEGTRLFKAAGDESADLPTVKVIYQILGETLYIRLVDIAPARGIR